MSDRAPIDDFGGPGFGFTGITLFGPKPVGLAHLRLRRGLLTMYGLNGSGKSTILRAVGDAFRGISRDPAQAVIHMRLERPDQRYPDSSWRGVMQAAAREHARELRADQLTSITEKRDSAFEAGDQWDPSRVELAAFTERLEGEEVGPRTMSAIIREVMTHFAPIEEEERLEPEFLALTLEIAYSARFALIPDGSEDRPRWRVVACADQSSACAAKAVNDTRMDARNVRDFIERARTLKRQGMRLDESFFQEFRDSRAHLHFPWSWASSLVSDWLYERLDRHRGASDWPVWAGVPAVPLGWVYESPALVLTELDDVSVMDALTRNQLAESAGKVIEVTDGDQVVYSETFVSNRQRVCDDANRFQRAVLGDSLQLDFVTGRPERWFLGDTPRWQFTTPDNEALSFSAGSFAEQRWALLAILNALVRSRPDLLVLALLDEPERGLHESLESRLVHTLRADSELAGTAYLLATHSARIIRQAGDGLIHVHRDDGLSTLVTDLRTIHSGPDAELVAERLGLSLPTLFTLTRVLVLVEGMHDKIALEHLISTELDDAAAKVLQIGGAKALPAALSASLLLTMTNAPIVVVLDNLAAAQIEPIWKRVTQAAANGDIDSAKSQLASIQRIESGEAKWLHAALAEALESGTWARITPFPLSQPDIICYLEPAALLGDSGRVGWTEIIKRWHKRGRSANLKEWIGEEFGVKVGIRKIKLALNSSVASADLTQLALKIVALSQHRR